MSGGIRPSVDRISPQGQRTTLIITPWHKWFWMGPQPALTWFAFGLVLLFLTKGKSTGIFLHAFTS